MVAFAASILILVAGIVLCLVVGRRRPPGTPVTWGEAIVAGTFVFALMLLAYGIVPNEWLSYADDELLWRADKVLYKLTFFGRGAITISYEALRDVIVSIIYIAALAGQIILWSAWQKRGRQPALEPPTSAFGRPVARKV